MKKFLFLFLLLGISCLFAACSNNASLDTQNNQTQIAADEHVVTTYTYELALITDSGDINDMTFNQSAWEGLKKYAEENEISYTYYIPTEVSDAAYVSKIAEAVDNGAKVVVCPGSLFEVAIYEAQYQYPQVMFIILDGEPRTADYNVYDIEDNVNAIYFAEQEAGFLAGYAAVKNGFTKLGFMGGWAVPSIIRFGYGYTAGAKYAAAEQGISGVEIVYHYTNSYYEKPEIQTLAATWYNTGTEVIFACGGAMGKSIMAAAEPIGAYVIGVDRDQSGESNTVIVSATKNLSAAVYGSIEEYYNGEFHGGKIDRLTAVNNGVALSMSKAKFDNFTIEQYDYIYTKLITGEIAIPDDKANVKSAAEFSNDLVKVTIIE